MTSNSQEIKKEQTPDIQPAYNWIALLFISSFLSVFGTICQYIAPMVAAALREKEMFYFLLILGYALVIAGIIAGLFFIKNMIVEANVRALEIFYGKERQIKAPEQTYETEN